MHPFILKFSAVRNLSDARYAAGVWADFIGFCFDPSDPSFIEPKKAAEIAAWIKGTEICAEFGNQPPEWIIDICDNLGIKVVQIPSDYKFEELFNRKDMRFIMKIDASSSVSKFKPDIYITTDIECCIKLRLETAIPVILELKDFETDPDVADGIAFLGENEEKPGMRNQSEWTDYLEKWSNF